MNRLISQEITAGNNFNEEEPDKSGETIGTRIYYKDLGAGGRFDFKNKQTIYVNTIAFDFADAVSWSISILVRKGEGEFTRHTIENDQGEEDNKTMIVLNEDIPVDVNEYILVNTEGATESMHVSIRSRNIGML